MDYQTLKNYYIDQGLNARKIATIVNKPYSAIYSLLKKYGFDTTLKRKKMMTPKESKVCIKCNILKPRNEFGSRSNSNNKMPVYCKQCNKIRIIERLRNVKQSIVDYLGGKCSRCGYNRCLGALQVHHLDPSSKSKDYYSLRSKSFGEKTIKELEGCILLCANCHAEEHTSYCSCE